MGTSQNLADARASAARGVIEMAQRYIDATVPRTDQITGSMLIGHFMVQQPPFVNATALLAPMFAFISAVQDATRPFVEAALSAGTPDGAYDAIKTFDPTVVPPPTIDVWGTKYPSD